MRFCLNWGPTNIPVRQVTDHSTLRRSVGWGYGYAPSLVSSVLVGIVLVLASHDDNERAERVKHVDGALLRGEHIR